jgi:WD40 repeat protein
LSIKERDLVISLSDEDIKLGDINNFECILQINRIYNYGILSSACILNIKDQLYIISSNYRKFYGNEPIKVFDLNGNKIKEINDSNHRTVFVDTYYSKKSKKNYIISSILQDQLGFGIIKIYDFVTNSEYHKYYVESYSSFYFSVIIYENDNYLKVLASNNDGRIRIWDFKSEKLLKVIFDNNYLKGICLWKNKYLLTASNEGIIVIDIKKEKIIKNLYEQIQIDNIKMINHPTYGDSFIISNLKQLKIYIVYNIFIFK